MKYNGLVTSLHINHPKKRPKNGRTHTLTHKLPLLARVRDTRVVEEYSSLPVLAAAVAEGVLNLTDLARCHACKSVDTHHDSVASRRRRYPVVFEHARAESFAGVNGKALLRFRNNKRNVEERRKRKQRQMLGGKLGKLGVLL